MHYPRYALYYIPRYQDELYKIGSQIIGYSIEEGSILSSPHQTKYNKSVSKYGLHGTLVAPFNTLLTQEDLLQFVTSVCSKISELQIGFLKVYRMPRQYIALIPDHLESTLNELDNYLVRQIHQIRLPICQQNIPNHTDLSEQYVQNILKWGYKYVFDDFNFHITLTDVINDEQMLNQEFYTIKNNLKQALNKTIILDSVCLVRQDKSQEPFKIIKRINLSS